jgi:hypothetical protein
MHTRLTLRLDDAVIRRAKRQTPALARAATIAYLL